MKQCRLCTDINILSFNNLFSGVPYLCEYCLELLMKSKNNSFHCQLSTSSQDTINSTIIAPFVHQGLCKILTHNFKYRRQLIHGRILTDFLIEKIRCAYHFKQYPDAIIPIPAHTMRLIERTFSHTEKIGSWLSTALQIPSYNLLRRVKNTSQQAGLSRTARLKNVAGTFALHQHKNLQWNYPIKCAIIDDVITTGATTCEAQRTLEAAFPDIEIVIWSLTQVPSTSIMLHH